jgi:hypothetical protein
MPLPIVRAFLAASALLLILFAVFQYNDPDPALWILIYGAGALVPLMVALNFYRKQLLWFSVGLCCAGFSVSAGGAFVYFASHIGEVSLTQGMSPDKPFVEETREFLGTVIVAIVLFISRRSHGLVENRRLSDV